MAKIISDLAVAVKALAQGKVVAFPTETVYGLGAHADNDEAIKKVFALKQRPANHPLIIHIANIEQMEYWVQHVPSVAVTLADKFWPGPLTLVLKRKKNVGTLASGGRPTIALRIPAHPVAQQLLEQSNVGLVAPSANRFSRPSPTKASHVLDDFVDQDVLVLDGGSTQFGIESTVIEILDEKTPRLLRPGVITKQQIQEVTGKLSEKIIEGEASGTHEHHYAPKQPVKLVSSKQLKNLSTNNKTAVISFAKPDQSNNTYWFEFPTDPAKAAQNLFDLMRQCEATDAVEILIQHPPKTAKWTAITDRLIRAASTKK